MSWPLIAILSGEDDMTQAHVSDIERQMRLAPRRAVFICRTNDHEHVEYARQLATRLGRDDLEIWPPSMLDNERNVVRHFTGVVLDHAAMLTTRQTYTLVAARQRVRAKPEDMIPPGCTCREFQGDALRVEAGCPLHGSMIR